MSTSFNIRPTQIEIGSEVYVVRHVGTGRTEINLATLVSRTSDEAIAKLTAEDNYKFEDAHGNDITISPSVNEKNSHLVIEGSKVRVSFWKVTDESSEMKRISDEANAIRQRGDDARAEEKKLREKLAEERAERAAARGTTTKVSKRETIEKRIAVFTKRQETQAADLEKTQVALKTAIDELEALDAAEIAKSEAVQTSEDSTKEAVEV